MNTPHTTTRRINWLWLGMGAGALCLTGCESLKSALEEDTAREEVVAATDDAAAQVAEVNGRIDDSVRRLEDIADHPAADLDRQYDGYVESLNRLDEATDRLRNLNEAVQRKGREYLIEWDGEIANIRNEDLREETLERRGDVSELFDTLQDSYAAARDVLAPLKRQLNDMKAALSVDLTASGVQNVQDNVDDVQSAVENAKDQLRQLATALRRADAAFSAQGTTAATSS